MKSKYLFISLTLIAFLFFQCHKSLSYIGSPDTGITVNPDPITANVQGNIIDENNQPAAGVAITAGTSTTITDANGFFHINNASLDKNTTLVTAQKDGYFKAYRVFAATSGCNQVIIKLIKQTLAGTIKSSSGGEVSFTDGLKINLSANSVVNASSGSDFSGDIQVYASYINPKASDISKTVPGSFTANDKNGKRVLLSSYGMLAVELQSSNGEKLQIKQGNVATLTIPIPSSAIASAPSSISLWYIDEQTGIWQEEGTASKNGNVYTGTVKHFSYWNCDYPYDAVNLSFTLHTPDDAPLVNAYVEVIPTDSTGGLAHGYTDSLGQVKGLVPANKSLVLEVFSLCGDIIYSRNIDAINQSTDLGTIKISGATSSLLTFTGTLLNCSAAPVTKGYVLINFNGTTRFVATDANGQFTTTYIICSSVPATATVLGVDEDNQQQGSVTTVNTTSPSTNAGNVTACGTSSEQFINFSLDNINYSITSAASDSLIAYTETVNGSSGTFISGIQNSNTNNSIIFTVLNAGGPGSFPLNTLYVRNYNYNSITLTQPFNITFTNFASNVGEFYQGSFSGQFTDSLSEVHTINSTFKVRRNF